MAIQSPAPATEPKRPLPRGVLFIAVLMYLAAGVLVATAALPDTYLAGVPRGILFVGALALSVLATGLFRRRRWAWFAALAFVAVNGFYLYRGVFQLRQNQIVGLTFLALMAGYLLLPQVRSVYLEPRK